MNSAFDSGPVRYRRGGDLFFWGFALFSLLILLGWNAFRGSECRWAEGVREMLLRRDIMGPVLSARGTEVPLPFSSYLALPFARFGGLSEFFLRLPCALLALAGVFFTRVFAECLGGNTVSRCTGYLLLGSYGFLFWGRMAGDDIISLTVSAFLFMQFFRNHGKPMNFLTLFSVVAAFGFGIAANGVSAPLVTLCILLPFFHFQNVRDRLFRRKFAAALLLSLLIGLVCIYGLSRLSSGTGCGWRGMMAYFIRQLGQGFRGSWTFPYGNFLHLPRLILPWIAFFGGAVSGLLFHWQQLSDELKKLLKGAGGSLVLLLFLPDKEWYHLLPLLPVSLFLTAEGLLTEFGRKKWSRFAERMQYYFFLICASLGVATLVALPLWNNLLRISPPSLLVTALPVTGALALWVCWQCRRDDNFWEPLTGLPHPLGGTVLAGTILMTGLLCVVLPATGSFRTGKPFFEALRNEMAQRQCQELFVYRNEIGADGAFYLRLSRPVRRAASAEELAALWENMPEEAALMVQRGDVGNILEFLKKNCSGFDPEKPVCAEAVTVRFDGKLSVPEPDDWVVWFLTKEKKDINSWKQGEKNAEQ